MTEMQSALVEALYRVPECGKAEIVDGKGGAKVADGDPQQSARRSPRPRADGFESV